jgi:hypothetical protein
MAEDAIKVWRRFGVVGAALALAVCALLIGAQRPSASATCIVLAIGVLVEGVALLSNWRGVANVAAQQTRGMGDVFRFRPWEVRVFGGGVFTLIGAVFVAAGLRYV